MKKDYGRSPVEDAIWELHKLELVYDMINEFFDLPLDEKQHIPEYQKELLLPKFCGNCKFLVPHEKDQQKGQKHWCGKYNQQVFHQGHHPEIVRVWGCDENLD